MVKWTSAPEEGDAAEAVAEIGAWLRSRPAGPADWEGMLGRLRDGLRRLWDDPMLRADPISRTLLLRLAETKSLEEVDAVVDALRARAAVLADARVERFGSTRSPAQLQDQGRRPSSRTVVKL